MDEGRPLLNMKLTINLATHPLENKRSFLAFAAVVGAIEVFTLVVLSHAAFISWRSSRDLRLEIAGYRSQIHSDLQKQQELRTYFQTPKAAEILNRAAFLNSLIDERGFPWTKVFMDIEQTLPPGVRVVSIAPRLVDNRAKVTLVVGADSDENMVKFLQALEKSNVFSGMEVKEEHYAETENTAALRGAPSDKIQVSLTVWYETT
jgi:Tfp pilus assembly protein PilN